MDKNRVLDWIKENGEKLELGDFNAREIESGESNHNVIVETEDEKYVLRVSRDVSRENRLENEAEKLDFLESQGIQNVPRKAKLLEDTQIGTVLLETYVGKETVDPGKFDETHLRNLAGMVAEIHSIPTTKLEEFGGEKVERKTSLYSSFKQDFEKWSKRPFNEYLELSENPDPRLEKFFGKQEKLVESIPEKTVRRGLTHGDLGFNIRVDGDKVFIVDWEFSRPGYPGNEIMYFFEHEDLDQHQREVFLEEYRKHRELGEVFEKVREIYPGFIAFNDAVWAAKRIEEEPGKEDVHRQRLEDKIEKLEEFYTLRGEI